VVKMRIPLICLLLVGCSVFAVAAASLQDPLRPGGYSASASRQVGELKAEPEPVWQLTAVLFSDARLVAVINDQTVQVGDFLGGYRVKSIERDQVVLSNKDRTMVVRRAGTGLKKPATTVGVPGKEGSAQ
jgi:hypothetical protein